MPTKQYKSNVKQYVDRFNIKPTPQPVISLGQNINYNRKPKGYYDRNFLDKAADNINEGANYVFSKLGEVITYPERKIIKPLVGRNLAPENN